MPDVSQVERQLYVLSILSESRRGFTIEEIISNLKKIGIDVSRKTVERDIDYITGNFFVYEEQKGGKNVYFAKKYSIPNVAFTISELLSLYFTREVLNFYRGLDVGVTAAKIIDRIIASAPQINKRYLNSLNNLIKVYVTGINPERELNPEHLDLLQEAVEKNICVELEYYSFNNDEMTERVFEPYFLEIYEGCWHVVGHCHLRHKIRDFRVSRIKSVRLTKECFVRPENFYENYKQSRFNKLSGEKKVHLHLLFTGHAARFIEEYEYSKADVLQKTEDGLLFERTVAMSPEILKWVLSFGAEVKVLEPAILRDEVMKQIKQAGELYGQT